MEGHGNTEEWIKNVVHTYNGILVIKKNKIMPLAETWMYLEIVILSEESHKEEKYHMLSLICGI